MIDLKINLLSLNFHHENVKIEPETGERRQWVNISDQLKTKITGVSLRISNTKVTELPGFYDSEKAEKNCQDREIINLHQTLATHFIASQCENEIF